MPIKIDLRINPPLPVSGQIRAWKIRRSQTVDDCGVRGRGWRSALEAQQYGVNSTPSFFINGIPLIGAQPIAAFEKLIDAEIEASRSGTRQ